MNKNTAIYLITQGFVTDPSEILYICIKSDDDNVHDLVIKTLDLASKSEEDLARIIYRSYSHKLSLKILKLGKVQNESVLLQLMFNLDHKTLSLHILKQISFSTLPAERQYEILKKARYSHIWEAAFECGHSINRSKLIALAEEKDSVTIWWAIIKNGLITDMDHLLRLAVENGNCEPAIWDYYISQFDLEAMSEPYLMDLIYKILDKQNILEDSKNDMFVLAALKTGNIKDPANIAKIASSFHWECSFVIDFIDLRAMEIYDTVSLFYGVRDVEFWIKLAEIKGILSNPDELFDFASSIEQQKFWEYIADQKLLTDKTQLFNLALQVTNFNLQGGPANQVAYRMLANGLTTDISQLLAISQKSNGDPDIDKYLDAECEKQLVAQTTQVNLAN